MRGPDGVPDMHLEQKRENRDDYHAAKASQGPEKPGREGGNEEQRGEYENARPGPPFRMVRNAKG